MSYIRVLVCQGNSILDFGIDSLLRIAEGMIVISASPKDAIEMIELVERHQPDVVIFGEWIADLALPALAQLFGQKPGFRVVIVSENHNLLRVYQTQQVWLENASDLARMIQTV